MVEIQTINNEKLKAENLDEAIKTKTSSRSIIILLVIFIGAVILVGSLYKNFPKLEPQELEYIKLPGNLEDVKNLGRVLKRYNERYFYTVLLGFVITYVFLQSFAIPGSIFLSILSGFLFPFSLALFLVCLCSALGASFCYLISYYIGRPLVLNYFPEKVQHCANQVEKHRSSLFSYILFIRITPLLPNWLINIVAPVIDIPLFDFFFGTFLGVAPPSFFFIKAGTTLNQMSDTGTIVSWNSVILLGFLAMLSIVPTLFKKKLQSKLD